MSVAKINALIEQSRRELADKLAALLTLPSEDAPKPVARKRASSKRAAPKATPKKRGRPKGSKNKKSSAQAAATLAGAAPAEAST